MRTRLLTFLAVCSLVLLNSVAFGQKPIITYSATSYTFTVGTPITPLPPTNTGGATGVYGATTTFANVVAGAVASVVTYDPVNSVFYGVDYTNGYLVKITTAGVRTNLATTPINNNAGSGIIVDNIGNIYVSDNAGNQVIEFNRANGNVIRTITGFTTPSGLAVDASNNVYVADGNGNIYKIPPGTTNTKSTFLTGFTTPYGVAFDGLGNLFVSQDGTTAATRNIVEVANALSGGTGKATFATGFTTAHNLTFDAYGNLFVADYGANNIKSITPTGTVATVLTGLTNPGQVDFDPAGNMYIADMNRAIKKSAVGNYFTISPGLPAGLLFNTSTGVISGNPSAASANTPYTITAYNNSGTGTYTINIACVLPTPTISYPLPSYTFTNGTAISTLTPTVTNNPTSYSISPNLTTNTGLIFNTTNGTISGTPTTTSGAVTYTVTATNASASGSTTISITVNNAPPPILNYADANPVYIVTPTSVSDVLNNTGGTVVGNYTITSGTLPGGLSLNPVNGTISGIPTTATAGPVAITVSGTNSGGTVSTTVNITVNNAPPPILNYADANPVYVVTGGLITPDNLSNTGGAVVGNYSITGGTLPAGLNFTPSSGQIFGTPTTATAGAVAITVSGTNSGGTVTTTVNITVNNPPVPAFTYTNPAAITYGQALPNITPANSGGAATSCTISPSTGGIVVSPTGVVSGTPNAAGTTVYTITPTNAGGPGPGATITITVSPKLLTVTADPKSKAYGAVLPTLTVTYSGGFVGSDSPAGFTTQPTISTTGTAASNVGTYPITASGAASSNYTFNYVAGTLTVTKVGLTITPTAGQTKAYGAVMPTLTYGITGFVNGDTQASLTTQPTISSTATAASPAGTYPLTGAGAVSPNYTFTYTTGVTFIITKVLLTITADDKSKTYGAANPTLTASYSGFVNGDTKANLTTQPALATTATAASPASPPTYPITASGAASNNYNFSYVAGAMTINKAPLLITPDNQTRDVGITITYTANGAGFVNGDNMADLITQPTITSTATAASGPGTYPITATGAASNNYTITYAPGTLTITTPGTHTAYIWDWTGTVNTAWENPLNWSINNVQQTASYPGSATNKDKVQIGVDILYPAAKSPVISATSSINLITFGTDNATQIGLTVNGTLNTTADITLQVDNNIFAGSLTINLSGTGTVNVPNLNVVNNQTALAFETANFNSSVAHLNVAGNISLTTAAFIFAGINSKFTLTGGITTVGGILKTTNNAVIFATTNSTFAIIPTVPANGAILNLTYANAIALDNNTSTLDFDHAGSFVNYTGTANPQTVYTSTTANASTGLKYQNLTISGTGTGVPAGGTLTVDKDMVTSGTTNFGTNAPIVNVTGNWTNTANVNQGGSNITVTTQLINNSNTITGGTGFLTTGSTLLTAGALNCSTGTVTTNGQYTNNGGAFNCGAGSVVFGGGYRNNSGTFSASTGMVTILNSQSLLDNTTAGTTFNNVTVTNAAGNAQITSGTGNFALSATGTLTMSANSKLSAGPGGSGPGYLTLMSGAASTARVDIMPAGAIIVGSVNVQRYLSGANVNYRGYRLLSSPVNISSNTGGSGFLGMSYLNTDASFGGTTYHGSFTEGPGTGFTLNGSVNPIIYLYDESKNTDNRSFTGGKNIGIFSIFPGFVTTLTGVTQANAFIPVGNSYLLYYVGDNTSSSVLATRVPENTSITATGYINQGDVPVVFWKSPQNTNIPYDATIDVRTGLPVPIFGLNQVGNPYASTISLDSVYFDNKPSISSIFWQLKEPGQTYVSFNAATHTTSGTGASAYIVSGQGFLIAATAANKTITFHEKQKVNKQLLPPTLVLSLPANPSLPNSSDTPANASLASLLPEAAAAPVPVNTPESLLKGLHLQLSKDSVNYTQTGIYFSSKWTDTYKPNDDAVDLDGTSPKVFFSSYSSDSKRLSINQLGDVIKSKRIKLYAGVTSTGPYTISLADIANMDTNMYHIYLVDNNLKDSVDMLQNRSYAFTINNSDTSTWGANRFVLVIERLALPPYKLVNFSGQKVNNGVSLSWKTMNEGNYTGFVLQKLVSGTNFNALYTTQSTGAGLYSYVDQHPVNGNNTYRLQQTGADGKITYSALVTVNYTIKPLPNGLTIYPNPSSSIINISLVSNILSRPNYIVDIYNTSGKVISHKNVNTDTWKQDISSYRLGIYIIEIKTNGGYLVGKSKFVKVN